MKAVLVSIIVAISSSLPAPADAGGLFDGITLIELDDHDGEQAITGRPRSALDLGHYIVTFVSARGSYAALVGYSGTERGCAAWAAEGSYDGRSITFGIPPSTAADRSGSPRICRPFTLTMQDDGDVDVVVPAHAGTFGTYRRTRKIAARVPLVPLDWGSPIFGRHSVNDVALGPIPAIEEAIAGRARLRIGSRDARGPTYFEAIFEREVPDPKDRIHVYGDISPSTVTGWPWDVLFALHNREGLEVASPRAAFMDAVVDRYGLPSFETRASDRRIGGERVLVWAYDLAGRKIGREDAAPGNCLGTIQHWISRSGLSSVGRDVDLWGCALVVVLSPAGGKFVGGYRVEAVSGYAMALDHFFRRLEELQGRKERLDELLAAKPRF